MAELRFDKSRYRVNTSRKRIGQVSLDKPGVASRLAARASELGFRQSEIAAHLGIPKTTMGRIWKGENLPDSAALFPLSDLLGVSPRWLLYGGEAAAGLEAPDSDWRTLPIYELGAIGVGGKGEPVDSLPISRDWLDRTIRTPADLWAAEMPNDLLDEIAREGDMILCSDVTANRSELVDGRVYVLLLNGQPIIRRVTFEPDAIMLSTSNERLPPVRVAQAGVGGLDEALRPVARVRGALLLNPL